MSRRAEQARDPQAPDPQARDPQAVDAALASYDVIGQATDADLQAIARLAAQVCGVPTATVNLLDSTAQHQVATAGFTGGSAPLSESMCATTVQLAEPVHLRDARLDPRFADNVWVNGVRGAVRFYASTQLRTSDGVTVGTLCVFDEQERELEARQREALDELAGQVVQVLELRARAAALAAANGELARSNADLTAFAGRVAHDLRNPIAALTGFLALAQGPFGEQLSGRARECVEHASGTASRMAAQVDDLLAYAGAGAPARTVAVDLAVVAAGVVQDLRALLDDAGAEVAVAPLPTVPADPTLVRVLLLNLVSNAVKYARPGRPARVRVEGAAADGGWWLRVVDNGRGIAPEDRERAFELFTRLADAGDVPGSGIGLATCARVAQGLGGSLAIDDGDDGGTAVTLTVPASRPA